MNVNPLVSVVIPCYNHEQFVQDCIQSVIDQTYENIELIIIDDGSKDHSVEKIQTMISKCEKRFTRFEFRTRPNKGLSTTLNESLEWCQGEYYSAIASDDMLEIEKVNLQVDYLSKTPNCVAVFGGYHLIDDHNNILETRQGEFQSYQFEDILLHKHDLPAPTQMMRSKFLLESGGYREDFIIEDWYMWLKLSEHDELHYLNNTFAKYRSHLNNTSKKIDIMNKGRTQVLNEYVGHPLYLKATQKINWIYIMESRHISYFNFSLLLIHFTFKNPFFAFNSILTKLFK